jgi:beta-phosphoglucomutase-like phosphatase (HAD superfamily)
MTRISYLPMSEVIAAVVFDLDGVLVDSESVWDAARREVVARNGGRWQADATRAMMGMSSPEWSRYPPEADALALAALVVKSLDELTPEAIESAAQRARKR